MALSFFKRSQSAFSICQDQSDKLIKEINKDVKKCESVLKKKQIDELQRNSLKEICSKNLERIAEAKKTLSELKEENEPKPVQKFDLKKEEKLKKLDNLESEVRNIFDKLDVAKENEKDNKNAPDCEVKKDVNDGEGAEDGDEEDDDDDDEEDNEDDTDTDNDGKMENEMVEEKKLTAEDKKDKIIKTSNKTSLEHAKKKSVTLVTEKSDGDDDDDDDEEEEEEEEQDVGDDDEVEEGNDEEVEQNEEFTLPDGENLFVALKGFPGQQEGDLSFKKNEKLKVLKIRADNWMVAINMRGEQGLVPGNFFERYSDASNSKDAGIRDESEGINEDDEKKDNEEEDEDEEEDEEEEEEEEDDVLFSDQVKKKKIGFKEKTRKKLSTQKGIDLWSQLRASVGFTEEKKTELIRSLSSVPSGYREPTLPRLSLKTRFSLKHHMHPSLSISCLNYKDLAMDTQNNQVELKRCRVQCILDLISVRNVPLPSDTTAIKILDRHVRICLFDGQNFLSNILVVKLNMSDEDYNLWKFNNQANSPSSEFSQIFIRSNSPSSEFGVLLELTITLHTEVETIDLSCGWCFFKLLDETGFPLPNRTYQLPINGGTPFEKGIQIDKKSDQPKNRKFSFASFAKSIKDLPIFIVKLSSPKKTQNLHLESLPEVMIGQTSNLFFFYLYRQYLLDALIRHRNDPQSTEVLHSPLLSSMTEIFEKPDIIDVLRTSWNLKLKSLSWSEKKSIEKMKAAFLAVFMENVYPLIFSAKLNQADHQDLKSWKIRNEEVQNFIRDTSGKTLSGLNLFMKPNTPLTPFDTKELTFNLLDSKILDLSFANSVVSP